MAQGPRFTRTMERPCPSRAGSWLRFTLRSWKLSTRLDGSGPPRLKAKSSGLNRVICCCKGG